MTKIGTLIVVEHEEINEPLFLSKNRVITPERELAKVFNAASKLIDQIVAETEKEYGPQGWTVRTREVWED